MELIKFLIWPTVCILVIATFIGSYVFVAFLAFREGQRCAISESEMPAPEVCKKIIAAKNALTNLTGEDAISEAYYQLSSIADPTFSSTEPWKRMEARAALAIDS